MTATLLLPLLLSADPLVSPEADAEARRLVTKLGDDNFRVRQAAAKELKRLGHASIPALMDGLKDTDFQRAGGCRKLLPDIEWWKSPQLLKFVLMPKSDPSADLPELDHFFRLTGDSAASRELYAEMVTVHAPRLGNSVGEPDLMEQIFVNHRQQTLTTRGSHWDLRFDREFFETRAGATLYFFLASDPRYDDRYQLPKLEKTPLGNFRLGDEWLSSEPLRKLYFDWIVRERSWFLKRTAMEATLRAKIPEALTTLSLLVGSARTPSEVRDCAEMLLLVRDYPPEPARRALQPLTASGKVTDNGVCISDVTFGVLLLADGKSLAESGYSPSLKGELTLEAFRLTNAEARERVVKGWK